ncbi:MAG: biotin transporter BioY [Candidatus Methanogasteraceae archaeon]
MRTTMSRHASIKPMIYASLFAALTAIGAFVRIPVPVSPVPITIQVFFVLLSGLVLGSRWAGASMAVYVMIGIIGFPVFSGGSSGIGVIMGPTGGYLIGFIGAAYVTGLIAETFGRNTSAAIGAMIAGLAVIYLFGVMQLSIVAHLPIKESVATGVLPFLIGDFIKLIAALIVFRRIEPSIEK